MAATNQCWMVTLRPSTLTTAARPARAPLVMPCGRPSCKLVFRSFETGRQAHTGSNGSPWPLQNTLPANPFHPSPLPP